MVATLQSMFGLAFFHLSLKYRALHPPIRGSHLQNSKNRGFVESPYAP